jgi:hypothetical protein
MHAVYWFRMKQVSVYDIVASSSSWLWPLSFSAVWNVLRHEGYWNSGRRAPGWIRFDVGSCIVCKIELRTKVFGNGGRLCFRVRMGCIEGNLETVYRYSGFAVDNDLIVVNLGMRRTGYVEILTTASPCWVAWRDVRIFCI